ncbi:MAG TPA: UDP-N-acetyl-D-mannosamine dehydrogenase, partial [Alcanivorax sp.]|nr:UDP-N-acetyl-D-mannosamine dehydrogenase [Alcanivorax sp.]
VNSGKPDWVVEKIKTAVGEFLQANPDKRAGDVTIACFGLAFKPDIDDLRESPALDIATRVAAEHPGPLLAVEPNIKALPAGLAEHGAGLVAADQALADADVVVALVAHRSFRRVAPAALDGKRVVDACGLWNRAVP